MTDDQRVAFLLDLLQHPDEVRQTNIETAKRRTGWRLLDDVDVMARLKAESDSRAARVRSWWASR